MMLVKILLLCSFVHAEVDSWSSWTSCFLKDERLQRTREEICEQGPCENPTREVSFECEVRPVFSAWMNWEPCIQKYNLCQRSRKRLCMRNEALFAVDSYQFITDYRVVPRNFSISSDAISVCGKVHLAQSIIST
jgi:hypothetical protein